MNLLPSAKLYKKEGLSVISTDNTKRSIGQWKQYQTNIATDQQLEQMFSHPKCEGIAIIAGAVSGNLEIIDVDCKYEIGMDLWHEYSSKIHAADKALYDKLLIVQTKSKGYHIYYRCETIEGNKKLAERPATDDEIHKNPNVKQCVLIETRGEAGYVIAPPSAGYNPIQLNPIPIISVDERDTLLSLARSFNQIIVMRQQANIPHNNDILTVWDDYNKRGDVISLLEKHGWKKVSEYDNKIFFLRPGATSAATSAVFFNDKRIFFIHTTSSLFENKGYNPFGVYTMLECNGDDKKAAKQLSDVYGTKNINGWFWTKNVRSGLITLNKYALQNWLFNNGYQLYFHDINSSGYRLIHEEDKKIKEVFPETIKKFIKKNLEESGDLDVMEAVIKNTNSIFCDSFFEYIDKSKVKILHDLQNSCYFPFKNGIVTVTNDELIFTDYEITRDKAIWENQINEFNIEINNDYNPDGCEYYDFIRKISGEDNERVKYAMSIIGYILHSYKDSSRPYAIILAEETDDESKGGGTGKGIFFKAISKLIPTVTIDGKNFKPDKTFAFQRVTLGTKLVVIEDCPKNVEFERYYPTITEGMTVEKKNKDEMFLSFEESPKIAFTTNYSIASNAEHAKRRQRVLEFAPFFSSKYTPVDLYGHKFFDEWIDDEWQKFYNFMFYCVQQYLMDGIKQIDNSEKLLRKQLKQQFGEDFLDYFDNLIENKNDTWLFITDEWKGFLASYELDKKDYSLKRFKKALEIGTTNFNIDYIDQKNHQNNGLKEFKITKKVNGWVPITTDSTDLF